MPRSGEGIVLGNLTELVLENGHVIPRSELSGCLLAWVPSRKDLIIVRKGRQGGRVSSHIQKLHRDFHEVGPSRCSTFDWIPPEEARVHVVGRLRSLKYSIPRTMKSPLKSKYRWDHAFGDHGERGHGPSDGPKRYPRVYMPALCESANGDLYIKRVAGNKYFVKDWIIW